MRRFPLKPIRLKESALKTNLGQDNFIFVGSGTDMFAENVPTEWILKVWDFCKLFPKNDYLFQSKNPLRFLDLWAHAPSRSIFATTIETNRDELIRNVSSAPSNVAERIESIRELRLRGCETQITIEPIMDFDVDDFTKYLDFANPDWIIVGADSKKSNLPEPSLEKVVSLAETFVEWTKKYNTGLVFKDNLKRITGRA
jgi:DNA repair photolyase